MQNLLIVNRIELDKGFAYLNILWELLLNSREYSEYSVRMGQIQNHFFPQQNPLSFHQFALVAISISQQALIDTSLMTALGVQTKIIFANESHCLTACCPERKVLLFVLIMLPDHFIQCPLNFDFWETANSCSLFTLSLQVMTQCAISSFLLSRMQNFI